MAFDTAKSQLVKNNFAVGYDKKDFVLHTNVNDGQVLGQTNIIHALERYSETKQSRVRHSYLCLAGGLVPE